MEGAPLRGAWRAVKARQANINSCRAGRRPIHCPAAVTVIVISESVVNARSVARAFST